MAVACLYLALRKKRQKRQAGRLEVVFEEVFLFFFFVLEATYYSSHAHTHTESDTDRENTPPVHAPLI